MNSVYVLTTVYILISLIVTRFHNVYNQCSCYRSICWKDQLEKYLSSLLKNQKSLNVHGLVEAMRRKPDVWETVFKCGMGFYITADEFLDQLEVQYSPIQMQKEMEVDTFKFFCDVVEKLELGTQ